MNAQDIEKFDPTVADLEAMVEQTRNLTASDLEDKQQLEVVRAGRIALKNARVKIEKIGKSLRADAVKFQKDVIAKEKSLIAIIEPEEERLAAIEAEAKQIQIRKERELQLPERLARIESAGLSRFHYYADHVLLDMNDIAFDEYFNKITGDKINMESEELAAKQAEIDAKEKELEEERLKLEHEKEVTAAAEMARVETEKRLAKEAKEKEVKDAWEKKAAEEAKKAEKKKLERRKAYVEWRESLGYTVETKDEFKILEEGDSFVMYKKLGTFKK